MDWHLYQQPLQRMGLSQQTTRPRKRASSFCQMMMYQTLWIQFFAKYLNSKCLWLKIQPTYSPNGSKPTQTNLFQDRLVFTISASKGAREADECFLTSCGCSREFTTTTTVQNSEILDDSKSTSCCPLFTLTLLTISPNWTSASAEWQEPTTSWWEQHQLRNCNNKQLAL